jgi:hypothetical protein
MVWKLARDHWAKKRTDIQWVALSCNGHEIAYIRWQKFPDNGPAYSWWFYPEPPGLHRAYTAEDCKAQIEVAWRAWQKKPSPWVITSRETCQCGAVYDVEYCNTELRETGHQDCVHCGRRLASWKHSRAWPEYTLVSRPDDDRTSKAP